VSLFPVVVGCATSGTGDSGYRNFLVLGIADNYSNRAYYEREVAAELRGLGATATPYYQAAGSNAPIDRDSVRSVVRSAGFDAVLVTRILDRSADVGLEQGSVAARATRRDDRPFDFFRYDYEQLGEPGTLSIETAVTVAGELYEAGSEEQVWATTLESPGASDIGELIEETAAGVVRRLDRARFIAR
jgi:hypothetical protein